MLRVLRRSRSVALLLLLAMPGVGGALVQAGHHCADKAPWSIAGPEAQAGHQHHGEPAAPAGQPGHPCECVGACQGAGAPSGPAAVPALAAAQAGPSPAPRVHSPAESPRPRPHRLLPPANAPPLS